MGRNGMWLENSEVSQEIRPHLEEIIGDEMWRAQIHYGEETIFCNLFD